MDASRINGSSGLTGAGSRRDQVLDQDLEKILLGAGIRPKKGSIFSPQIFSALRTLCNQDKIDVTSVSKALSTAGLNLKKGQPANISKRLSELLGKDNETIEKAPEVQTSLLATQPPIINLQRGNESQAIYGVGSELIELIDRKANELNLSPESRTKLNSATAWYLAGYSEIFLALRELAHTEQAKYGEIKNVIGLLMDKVEGGRALNPETLSSPDVPFTMEHVTVLDTVVRTDILIPNGLSVIVTRQDMPPIFSLTVKDPNIHRAPSGREVPVYDLHYLNGRMEFDGLSLSSMVVLPHSSLSQTPRTFERFKVLSQSYESGSYRPPLRFDNPRDLLFWAGVQFCRRNESPESMWKKHVLAEELIHSDATAFFEAVIGRKETEGFTAEDQKKAKVILKPESPFRSLIENRRSPQEKENIASALNELEAWLLVIEGSNSSLFPLVENCLHGIYPELPTVGELDHYVIGRHILSEEFKKELNLNGKSWIEFLSSFKGNNVSQDEPLLRELDGKIKQGARKIYQRNFYNIEERNQIKPGWTTYKAIPRIRFVEEG